MTESFIDTLQIKSKSYIFRFNLCPSEPIYTVSVINRMDIVPFKMAMTDEDAWKIVSEYKEEIKAFENEISKLIIDNNHLWPTR